MNIFKQLIISLYSPRAIAAFRIQGTGKSILYVFMLMLISMLPSFYLFSTTIINEAEVLQETINTDLPSFTIENGELTSEEPAPITINKSDLTVMFDSTGTVTSEVAKETTNSIFILKNEVVYTFAGQSQSMPYSVFNNMTVTKDDLIELTSSMDTLLPIFLSILAIIVYLFSTASKLIGVSFLALMGLLMNNILGKHLKYGMLWRMSAYCVTLPTIFFTIMEALRTIVPNGFFIYWFVAIIMLVLAMKEIPSSEEIQEN